MSVTNQLFKEVRKRDGRLVPFDITRITSAVMKAMKAVEEGNPEHDAPMVSEAVGQALLKKFHVSYTPSIEEVQDVVESTLISLNFSKTAKGYILYRNERSKTRAEKREVPEHVRDLVASSKQYFKNSLGEFVYYRTYAKWIENEQRRETWIETVDRYMSFMRENLGEKLQDAEYTEVREYILNQKAMPSMRLMQFAGTPAHATNVSAYNCSFIAPSQIRDFAEIMYISMCGTGVGFSVESKNIQTLPQIKPQTGEMLETHIVPDSKEGWAEALNIGMETWFGGKDIKFDFSQLRPAGARLKTMGGKSSGPEPLKSLLEFTRVKILKRQGRRLTNLDAHDVICKIGAIVVAGGVRRSAMISLSDLDDHELRDAKQGQFYITEPQRSIANNSAVYMEKPTNAEFLEEWIALMKSGTGERGIFYRGGLKKTLPQRRLDISQGHIDSFGTNPCGEIILRSKQFCNLTEVIARAEDTEETLLQKTRIATILGTYQSSLTNFPFLSKEWKENCEEERLLGVSITGQWDCPAVRSAAMLRKMRDYAITVNQEYAKRFSIKASSAITCVKPSGTVSKTFDTASGMHPRHAPYYIQRIRISATDSLFKMLKDQGVPYHPEVGQTMDTANTFVLEFPVKSPDGAICKDDITAIQQLEYWKLVKKNFTEHNPSITISVGDDEWITVASWLYENWEIVGGLSFLPRSNHVYQLAPYEATTKEKYEELLAKVGDVDFSMIVAYEKQDETEVKKELACAGGVCEIEDVPQQTATAAVVS